RLALEHGEAGLAGLDVDAHDPAPVLADHPARSLDLEGAVAAVAGMEDEGPRPEAQDDAVVAALVARDVVELAAAVEAQQRSPRELELRASALVGPDPVPGEEREVRHRLLRSRLRGALDAAAFLPVA